MNNQKKSLLSKFPSLSKSVLLLIQFFLIIFVYHTLKDLKDTVVITASDAGAQVIPFIKIWGMLPASIFASFLFSKLYNKYGREKTLYIFIFLLFAVYAFFAFFLYPFREFLYLNNVSLYLTEWLPAGCKGFIAMVCFWHYTLFYLSAELWSPLILAILFWGYVNETTTLEEAKKFYPLCMFTGNFAGILSGQASHLICYDLKGFFSWEDTLQLMVVILSLCAFSIAMISRALSKHQLEVVNQKSRRNKHSSSFKENIVAIFKSTPLMCIAILVVGFGLTSNLIEVVWKENIRKLHSDPQSYNAYINQLTSIIGIFAVVMAYASRWLFKIFTWSQTALITPVTLFITSTVFFTALLMKEDQLFSLATVFSINPILLIVTIGSMHYVLAMTAKYTLFDTCKEMAFLSVDVEERIKAKSVIDSIGSRLGKSGSSCLYQFLLIAFGSTAGHISFIGVTSIAVIGISIIATKKLGNRLSQTSIENEKTDTTEILVKT